MEDRRGQGADAWDAAEGLARSVATGGSLPSLASPVLVEPGEVLHAVLDAYGWRFEAAEVVYERRTVVAGGGPLLFGITAAVSAVGNRRARDAAARHAAPQWRALGPLRVLATDRRLLVFHQGVWASVWLAAICQLHPVLEEQRLELAFEHDPPYAIAGPWVPYLAVVLTTALAAQRGVDAVAAAVVPA
jgi:hypothetical protein